MHIEDLSEFEEYADQDKSKEELTLLVPEDGINKVTKLLIKE